MTARTPIDIEALLRWTVQTEFAHIHAAGGGLIGAERDAEGAGENWEPRGHTADGTVALQRIAGLGCRPDESGWAPGHCHPDAEAVYVMARRVLTPPDLYLVIGCARTDTRPDWKPGVKTVGLRYQIDWGCAGNARQAVVVFVDRRRRARYCRVAFYDRSAEIDDYRETYRSWWRALDRLKTELQGTALKRWAVSRFAAHREPWRVADEGCRPLDMRRIS